VERKGYAPQPRGGVVSRRKRSARPKECRHGGELESVSLLNESADGFMMRGVTGGADCLQCSREKLEY
jgi:hypothetical protein